MAAPKPQFEKYRDRSGEWRWRLRAINGKIIADCAEGYTDERGCDSGIVDTRFAAAAAVVETVKRETVKRYDP